MALRNIRLEGDDILRKRAKDIDAVTDRIKTLAADMLDTMYHSDGVGLAAPQIGILKRIIVIDIGQGPLVFINPEIIETDGEQVGPEACLSMPRVSGEVKRPLKVKTKALNVEGEEFTIEGEGLLARAICHEIDHLNGVLFTDIATNIVRE